MLTAKEKHKQSRTLEALVKICGCGWKAFGNQITGFVLSFR